MAMTIHVNVVSAEREIYSGTAEMVFAPANEGDVGISPRHAPLLTALKPGEVRVQVPGGKEEHFYITGGMLEVQPHVVTVLADCVEHAADINEAAAMEAKERAEKMMADKTSEMEMAEAKVQLAQAMAQLRAIENVRKRSGTRH